MADIDVERKDRTIWPWVIGIVLLALLLWLLLGLLDRDEPEVVRDRTAPAPVAVPEPGTPADAAVPAAVSAYVADCGADAAAPAEEMGPEHEYTVTCLQQLRTAIEALVAGERVADTNVATRLEEYTGSVDQLAASDPSAITHANLTREAAGTAAELMRSMQTSWFAGNQEVQAAVGEAEAAAYGIQGGVPMLEQREPVRNFLREAGEALRTMAENRSAAAAA